MGPPDEGGSLGVVCALAWTLQYIAKSAMADPIHMPIYISLTPSTHCDLRVHCTILNNMVCMNFARGMMAKERIDMIAIKYPMVEKIFATEVA